MNLVEKLLEVFKCYDYGLSKLELLELWIEREDEISLEKIKKDLLIALKDKDFNWVEIGMRANFVYGPFEVNPEKFDVDDLLIFTDSFRWQDIVQPDAIITNDQRNDLKEQFREIGVQHFENINELIDHENFNWLPFEVKHAYKASFGEMTYTNDDIIYYLKNIIWEYLFPNSFEIDRLNSLKTESLTIMESIHNNEGWVEMSNILDSLKNRFNNLDLYELSRVKWDINTQHKNHYRNPFTLGFKRISPEMKESKS